MVFYSWTFDESILYYNLLKTLMDAHGYFISLHEQNNKLQIKEIKEIAEKIRRMWLG